jgi:hypothetical protein
MPQFRNGGNCRAAGFFVSAAGRVNEKSAAGTTWMKIGRRLAVTARSGFVTRQSDPQYERLQIAASQSSSSQ